MRVDDWPHEWPTFTVKLSLLGLSLAVLLAFVVVVLTWVVAAHG